MKDQSQHVVADSRPPRARQVPARPASRRTPKLLVFPVQGVFFFSPQVVEGPGCFAVAISQAPGFSRDAPPPAHCSSAATSRVLRQVLRPGRPSRDDPGQAGDQFRPLRCARPRRLARRVSGAAHGPRSHHLSRGPRKAGFYFLGAFCISWKPSIDFCVFGRGNRLNSCTWRTSMISLSLIGARLGPLQRFRLRLHLDHPVAAEGTSFASAKGPSLIVGFAAREGNTRAPHRRRMQPVEREQQRPALLEGLVCNFIIFSTIFGSGQRAGLGLARIPFGITSIMNRMVVFSLVRRG